MPYKTNQKPYTKKIALISPSSSINQEALQATLEQFEQLKIRYYLCPNILKKKRYFAGSIEDRLSDIYHAFQKKDINIIWCLRGGSGSGQLVSNLDWTKIIPYKNKILIGYSDITSLHNAFHKKKIPSIHGPTALDFRKKALNLTESKHQKLALQHLFNLINTNNGSIKLKSFNHLINKKITGNMIGGNLTVLTSLSGTKNKLHIIDDSILILEDINEPLYAIERSIFQLTQTINLKKIKAICLGNFNYADNNLSQKVAEILEEYTTTFNIPIYWDLPIGHITYNLAWPYGKKGIIWNEKLSWYK